MSANYAPASATPHGVVIGRHRRAVRSPSRTQWASGAAGKAADAEMVRLGIQLIVDGGLDVDHGDRLATRLGISHRRLRSLFQTYAGITPDQLARSSRAHFARRMLDDTDLPVTDIAFAAGFGSLRQFNRTMYGIFRTTPLALRARRRRGEPCIADGGVVVRLGSCTVVEWEATVAHLATQAIAGVEHIDRDAYRRMIVVDGEAGALEIRRGTSGEVLLRALLPQWRDLLHVIQSARRLLNLDVDLDAATSALGVAPGMRLPGTWEPFAAGIRAIIGHERDDDDANAIVARMVQRYGQPIPGFSDWGLTHTFPAACALARAQLDGIGLTANDIATVRTFADAVADRDARTSRSLPLDDVVLQALLATPEVNRMTADYVALRIGVRDAVVPDRLVAQGGLRQFLGQRRSQTIRLHNSDMQTREWESPIHTRTS